MDKIIVICPGCNQPVPTPHQEGEAQALGVHFRPPAELAYLDDGAHPREMLCPRSDQPIGELRSSTYSNG